LKPVVRGLLDDASPLVRGAAIWALSRLVPDGDLEGLAATGLKTEGDASVRDEWLSALNQREGA